MASLAEHLHGGVVNNEEIERVREALLFEEPERQRKLTRFFCLLVLATTIATFGLMANSVTTVIGAMIVAPLMLPIMGVAFGVGIGDRKIIFSSLITSILGIATAIAVGFLLTWGFRHLIDVETDTEIIKRTTPRLIDLLSALATGLAGAFATGRKDVSDTLPGVAISISLVPPLANVGILLATYQLDLAIGSLVLFVTNYLAILLTGSFMFSMMGFPKAYHASNSKGTKRISIAIAAVLFSLILIPLSASSYKTIRGSLMERRASDATRSWLAGSDYRLVSVNAGIKKVHIVIAGEGNLRPEEDLQDALRGRLFEFPVTMEIVPEIKSKFKTVEVDNQKVHKQSHN